MSIGFKPDLSLEQIANRSWEALDSPTVAALAQLAGRHHACVVCPIDRRAGDRRFNSAVLLDRHGQIACIKRPGVQPGQTVTVSPTDFGRIGLAICFDVNWPPLRQRLSGLGAVKKS